MNSLAKYAIFLIAAVLSMGCTVVMSPQQADLAPAVNSTGPVVTGPGVEVIQVEPPPDQRVYVYDPGYPPGAYYYSGYYWYGGYRYPHDVFVNQYVNANIRENRYVNVEENRRVGQQVEARHRALYATNHGVRPHPTPQPNVHPKPQVQRKEVRKDREQRE
jgi:hypothetical protein